MCPRLQEEACAMMANCHHRRVSLLLFVYLPCIAAIAVLSVWPRLWGAVSSSALQPSHRGHIQLFPQQFRTEEAYFLSPGAASLRGRRPYQEDRLLCAPEVHVSYPPSSSVGLFGVFDGHLGDSASDLAARFITERFAHHSSLPFVASLNMSSMGLHWLEAALLAAIADIDAAFGKIAAAHDLKAGSTACVSMKVHNQIMVANVGDSRAFLCSSCSKQTFRRSEKLKHSDDPFSNRAAVRSYRGSRHHISRRFEDSALPSHSEGFCVKRLSADHRPDRPDEKVRIEASGGFVTDGSVPRVNGQLAVSRSIGDIDFRKYGVISEPEVSGWHKVSENDKFLIVASDGLFETLSAEEVCDVLHALGSGKDFAWVMDRLEKNSDAVIALPGTKETSRGHHSTGGASNSDAQMLGAGDRPLTSAPHKLIKQGKDSRVMTLMRSMQDAPGYAQILARILVEIAYQTGSMDNLSVVVIPLKT
ncbi:hypothetical protein GOP47_0028008 [Adiantum capillus-veneris]|nr:hypothetical protein GOP47_0028008 [Adiantum capillus-veneris]